MIAALILAVALVFGIGIWLGSAIHRVNPSDEIPIRARSRIPVCIPRGSIVDRQV